jgi:leader peptidase (prepilin peptidase)/N-methyltransferase
MSFRPHWWDVAAGLIAVALSLLLLPLPASGFAAALAALAVAIAVIDIDHLLIPDIANVAVFVLGLILAAVEDRGGGLLPTLADALLRSAATGGLLYGLRFIYGRRTGVEGLGLGDVKLAAAAGPWLLWPTLPFAIAVAAVAALAATGARALLARERLQWRQELPFGAFLAPAIWMSFMIERLWLAPV